MLAKHNFKELILEGLDCIVKWYSKNSDAVLNLIIIASLVAGFVYGKHLADFSYAVCR